MPQEKAAAPACCPGFVSPSPYDERSRNELIDGAFDPTTLSRQSRRRHQYPNTGEELPSTTRNRSCPCPSRDCYCPSVPWRWPLPIHRRRPHQPCRPPPRPSKSSPRPCSKCNTGATVATV